MGQAILILAVFGILVFGIWSNVYAYGQQQQQQNQLTSSHVAGSGSNSGSTSRSISPELKEIMCDPSNRALKVVNSTEAHVCGIPKTVKPVLLSATPLTSSVSSSPSSSKPATMNQQKVTTTATKPTTTISPATGGSAHPKSQPTVATNNIPPSIGYITWATIASLSNLRNAPSPSSTIVPQVSAVDQQQQSLHPITRVNTTTGSNGMAGQNYTFTTTSPVSDKLMYLGFHDTTSSAHSNSGSKDKGSQDSKRHTHSSTRTITDNGSEDKDTKQPILPSHINIINADNGSTEKKKASSISKVDITPTNDNARSQGKISSSSDTKRFTPFPPIRIPLSNNDFTGKMTMHSTKLSAGEGHKSSSSHSITSTPPHIISTNHVNAGIKSFSRTDDSSKLLLSSELGSVIRNKVDSLLKNSIRGIADNRPFTSPFH